MTDARSDTTIPHVPEPRSWVAERRCAWCAAVVGWRFSELVVLDGDLEPAFTYLEAVCPSQHLVNGVAAELLLESTG